MCAQGIIRAECGVREKLMGENILWNASMCMAICSIDFHVFVMVVQAGRSEESKMLDIIL